MDTTARARARNIWNNLVERRFKQAGSSNRRSKWEKLRSLAEKGEITTITDPALAVEGIEVYMYLTGKLGGRRVRTDVVDDWRELFGGLPSSFPQFQAQLNALWIYNYFQGTESPPDKGLSPKGIHEVLRSIYKYLRRTGKHDPIDRILLYMLYNPQADQEGIYRMLKDERAHAVYAPLSALHSFMATCNLMSDNPRAWHRMHRSKRPGCTFGLVITVPGLYISRLIEEGGVTDQDTPTDIYHKLRPVEKYSRRVLEWAMGMIESALRGSALAGLAIGPEVSNLYNEMVRDEELGELARGDRDMENLIIDVLRTDIESIVLWAAGIRGLAVDPLAFMDGMLKFRGPAR